MHVQGSCAEQVLEEVTLGKREELLEEVKSLLQSGQWVHCSKWFTMTL